MLKMLNFVSILSFTCIFLHCLFIQIGLTVGFTVIRIFTRKGHCWGGIKRFDYWRDRRVRTELVSEQHFGPSEVHATSGANLGRPLF